MLFSRIRGRLRYVCRKVELIDQYRYFLQPSRNRLPDLMIQSWIHLLFVHFNQSLFRLRPELN